MKSFHDSVLLEEMLDALNVKNNHIYVDATLGGGGHSAGIIGRGGSVISIDVDPEAISNAEKSIRSDNLVNVQSNFRNLEEVVEKKVGDKVSGVIFDLGVSSFQLDSAERGFGIKHRSELDMRMDPNLKVKALNLIKGLNEGELYELFVKYGEERYARRIARTIVRSRSKNAIERTDQLAEIIKGSVKAGSGRIHPATRVFLALRIAVNDELNNLSLGLEAAVNVLEDKGRLVVISFHSLEDRIVKRFIKERNDLVEVSKKPIIPSEVEIRSNPRSRSAKMRVAEKIE